ncbi:MAG: hypothetical protein JO257_07400 [Deltaproteobacteria bacterium]|nr:hypothetical protein [Deltaproteobacteria bacterium]
MSKYDRAEAEALIARAAAATRGFSGPMAAAAKELLEALVELNGFCDCSIDWADSDKVVEIQFGSKATWLAYRPADRQFVVQNGESLVTVAGLRFDPSAARWEGVADDAYLVPTPGQPRIKRAAIAVLIENVCTVLGINVA